MIPCIFLYTESFWQQFKLLENNTQKNIIGKNKGIFVCSVFSLQVVQKGMLTYLPNSANAIAVGKLVTQRNINNDDDFCNTEFVKISISNPKVFINSID